MPIKPSVFRPIKSNDIHQRPFKAYKHFRISGSLPDGCVTQSAVHGNFRLDIDDPLFNDAQNSDGTNQHVIWKSLKHRFYTEGPGYSPELSLNHKTQRFLFYSASTVAIPYQDVGERIKKDSVYITASIGPYREATGYKELFLLRDDGNGNLRDQSIITSSFASSSREILYMTFNNEFVRFPRAIGRINENSKIKYTLNKTTKLATLDDVDIEYGVITTGSASGSWGRGNWRVQPSGLSAKFVNDTGSFIRIPHDAAFDKFNQCDDWTIAFWVRRHAGGHSARPLISKGGVTSVQAYDSKDGKMYTTNDYIAMPTIDGDYSKVKTPFMIGMKTSPAYPHCVYHFQASDGSDSLHITASSEITTGSSFATSWDHVVVRNSASLCEILVNTKKPERSTSGSLPKLPTGNKADIILGNHHDISYSYLPNPIIVPQTILPGDYVVYGNLTISTEVVISNGVNLTVWGDLIVQSGGDVTIQEGATVTFHGIINDESLIHNSGIITINSGYTENEFSLAEIRFYDYALNSTAIASLANRDYKSGSLYQSNIVGNSFYRNGQLVVSSPMPKYNSGSGFFGHSYSYDVRWRGTHTIYENEAMLRVPKDNMNVAMNPTATYLPSTVGDLTLCDVGQSGRPPGELRKSMFVSGTAYPYITTIGLYNDQAQMLAVAKLAQPIQKRDDVDMNFVVRWDY